MVHGLQLRQREGAFGDARLDDDSGASGIVGTSVLTTMSCSRESPPCEKCGTVVIAAVSRTDCPASSSRDRDRRSRHRRPGVRTTGRTCPGAAPIDSTAYQPRLASRWERLDSVTWRFHLRPNARWQDGKSVTPEDVRFSFEAFTDSLLDSPARSYLRGGSGNPEDSTTFLIRFAAPSPEELL